VESWAMSCEKKQKPGSPAFEGYGGQVKLV